MKYIILIYGSEAARATMTEQDIQAEMQEYFAFGTLARERGMLVGGEA